MKVYIERTREDKEIKFSGNGLLLLKKLKINPHTVILARNSEIVSEDIKLKDTDTVHILSVLSGG